jgi:hypothetical protein
VACPNQSMLTVLDSEMPALERGRRVSDRRARLALACRLFGSLFKTFAV